MPAKRTAKKRPKKTLFSLALPSSSDISYAENFFKEIKAGVKNKCLRVEIDASDVGRITTPVIQILLSVAKTMENKNGVFSVVSPSEAFCQAFSDLGMESTIYEWSKDND